MRGRTAMLAAGVAILMGCGGGSDADDRGQDPGPDPGGLPDANVDGEGPGDAREDADDPGGPGAYPEACLGFGEPSGTSCAGTGAIGCCDDQGRVVWCQGGMLYCHDCRSNPDGHRTCGWRAADGGAGYDCGGDGADPTGVFPLACGAPCVPECEGRACGSDGCGGYCGTCGEGLVCEAGRCVDPDAAYPDACRGFGEPSGGACPDFVSTYGCCDAQGRVVWCDRGRLYCNDCSRNPAPQDACGWFEMEGFQGYDCGGDGEDPGGLAPRVCGAACEPQCGTNRCGPDGCGGLCGQCDGDRLCSGGACVTPPGGVLTGRLRYEVVRPAYDAFGGVELGEVVTLDADRVPVAVVDAAGTVVGEAEAGADGTFRVPLAKALAGGETLLVTAGYRPAGVLRIAVLRPDPVVEPGALTSPMWAWSLPVPGMDVGTRTVTVAQGSGALHVYRMAVLGMDEVLAHLAKTTYGLPGLALLWAPDAPWSVGLAFGKVAQKIEGGPYLPQSIFVGGGTGTSGPWGEAVILHEFGHYIQNNFTRHDSPGGSHYVGELISPPFAWAEAFSNFFGVSTQSLLGGKPDGRMWLIVDYGKGATSSWWIDFAQGDSTVGAFTPPNPAGSMAQYLDEMYLTGMLWDLWDGDAFPDDDDDGTALGTSRFLRALVSDRFLDIDRGAVGVDFVDFADAVLCAEPALAASMTATLRDFLKFPYDGAPRCAAERAASAGPGLERAPFVLPAVAASGLRPPLEVRLAGTREGDAQALTATVSVAAGLGGPLAIRVVLPDGAELVAGQAVERLPAPREAATWVRDYRVRGADGPVTVSVTAGGRSVGAGARASWPLEDGVRGLPSRSLRPIPPVRIGEVDVRRAVSL